MPSATLQTSSTHIADRPALVRVLPLRQNAAWALVGNLFYVGCQWLMVAVLAKLGSAEKVGVFSLGLAVTVPPIILLNLQLRTVQATDARRDFDFADYFGLRLVTMGLAMLAILGIAAFSPYPKETKLIILALGLAKILDSISDVLYGLLQQHERMDRIAISMILKGLLALVALASLVRLTGSVLLGCLGYTAAWTLTLLTYDVRSALLIRRSENAGLRPRCHLATLRRLTWLALPLGLVMALLSLSTNVPRYVIERVAGVTTLGIYSGLAYLLVVGSTITGAVGQSVSPRLAVYYAAGDAAAVLRLAGRLLALALLVGLLGVLAAALAGSWLLRLLYTPQYASHQDAFVWLSLAAAFIYLAGVLGVILTAMRNFWSQVMTHTVGVMALLAASLVLIPRAGLRGAAFAILVSSGCLLCGYSLPLLVWVRRAIRGGESCP